MPNTTKNLLQSRRGRLVACYLSTVLTLSACAGMPTESDETASPEEIAEKVQAELLQGDEAYVAGDSKKALFHYISGLKLDEENIDILYRVGMLHLEGDRLEPADRAFNRILALEPKHPGALEGHGLVLLQQQNYAEAKQSLTAAIEIGTDRWRAQNGLGVISDIEKDHKLAISYYQSALEQRPRSAMVMNNLGYSNYLAGDWDAAEDAFRKAVNVDPKHEKAWSNLGMLYARQERYEDAIQAFSRMMPKPEALNSVGYVCLIEGKYARAEAFFSDAIRLAPAYYEEAQENLRRARTKRAHQPNSETETLNNLDVQKSR